MTESVLQQTEKREQIRARKINRDGFWALYNKELADSVHSKKFLIILALIAITAVGSIYGALSALQAQAANLSENFIFLKLFTATGNQIPSFVSFISLLGPLVGLVLGFDAINGERSGGTLSRLVSQPIYRDSIINAKFAAGATIIFILVFALGVIMSGIGLIALGIAPSGEEVVRIIIFFLFTAVYMIFWLGLSILFSVLCRHAATSALSVIAIWLIFAVFIGLLAGIAANSLYPITEGAPQNIVISNYLVAQFINRISPTYLFTEAVSTILDPTIRALGIVTTEQASGAIVGPLPLDQSIILVWPQLAGLAALTMITFAVSYICFMKQEVRAG